ncbi:MAG: hypothetical protein DLM53_09655 [Candidatus Eremiobacter antarcticus]|nr:hypothetical protein [Candidatus Eremiobacteraeota bacterium]MBC5807462.1 hypothetical protein [Candidatus Eremiobacteraeota bacterium]PZR61477.1 MAG: hypothetical protein DLM53_09655 [Candidatus Eremiobacter sp. RRmetagenome_bin22]
MTAATETTANQSFAPCEKKEPAQAGSFLISPRGKTPSGANLSFLMLNRDPKKQAFLELLVRVAMLNYGMWAALFLLCVGLLCVAALILYLK